ncbi:MAG: hypothetical protein EXR98_15185 [Gemmataceae bacterium]|nr:hypothetical protein [Gemmataceae bacterium]
MTRRYMLDSGPAFDFLFKRKGVDARVAALRRKGRKVGICVPVLGEIVGGLEASGSRDASWKISRPRLAKLLCWPHEKPAAYFYGQILAELKKKVAVSYSRSTNKWPQSLWHSEIERLSVTTPT